MIRDVVLAFDDWVSATVAGGTSGPILSSDVLIGRLGKYDRMAVQATFDTIASGVSGDVTVSVLHSGNGTDWMTYTEAISASIAYNQVNSFYGSNVSQPPPLPYVRLSIVSSVQAHARVHVILRDPSG